MDSQEIVWNSRNVEAIADSLINEDEEEDLEDVDHRHASDDDGSNVGDRKDPANDDSSKDDNDDAEKSRVNALRVESTVPTTTTSTAIAAVAIATPERPERSNSMLQVLNAARVSMQDASGNEKRTGEHERLPSKASCMLVPLTSTGVP
jgi:hypothetical protein